MSSEQLARSLLPPSAAAAPATVAESHDILYDFMMQINTRIDRLYWWMLLLAIVIILAVKL